VLGKLPTPPLVALNRDLDSSLPALRPAPPAPTSARLTRYLPPALFLLVQALDSKQSIDMAARSPSPAPRGRTDENIFLFVPNLIGPSPPLSHSLSHAALENAR